MQPDVSIVEHYQAMLDGKETQFPRGIWSTEIKQSNAVKCTLYLIETVLEWDEEQIKTQLIGKIFRKYKLGGMLDIVYNGSAADAIMTAYPGKFKPWELVSVPKSYWNEDTATEAIKWLIGKKLKWNKKQVCKGFTMKLLRQYKLSALLTCSEEMTLYRLLDKAYPNKYNPWDLDTIAKGYWTSTANIINAIKWLIEDKLNWSREQVCNGFNQKLLFDYNLNTLLNLKLTLHDLLDLAYPNEYKPWELKHLPNKFWTKESTLRAVRWIIEEKLILNEEQVYRHYCYQFITTYIAATGIRKYFSGDMFLLIDTLYPNKYIKGRFLHKL